MKSYYPVDVKPLPEYMMMIKRLEPPDFILAAEVIRASFATVRMSANEDNRTRQAYPI